MDNHTQFICLIQQSNTVEAYQSNAVTVQLISLEWSRHRESAQAQSTIRTDGDMVAHMGISRITVNIEQTIKRPLVDCLLQLIIPPALMGIS